MRSWEIIEQGRGDYDRDMGFRSVEEEEAYKEGCRHGYRKAMMEMQDDMGERRSYGNRGGGYYGDRRMQDYQSENPYMDDMGERRRRRSNGQWY